MYFLATQHEFILQKRKEKKHRVKKIYIKEKVFQIKETLKTPYLCQFMWKGAIIWCNINIQCFVIIMLHFTKFSCKKRHKDLQLCKVYLQTTFTKIWTIIRSIMIIINYIYKNLNYNKKYNDNYQLDIKWDFSILAFKLAHYVGMIFISSNKSLCLWSYLQEACRIYRCQLENVDSTISRLSSLHYSVFGLCLW